MLRLQPCSSLLPVASLPPALFAHYFEVQPLRPVLRHWSKASCRPPARPVIREGGCSDQRPRNPCASPCRCSTQGRSWSCLCPFVAPVRSDFSSPTCEASLPPGFATTSQSALALQTDKDKT